MNPYGLLDAPLALGRSMSVQKGFANRARLYAQQSVQHVLMALMARRYAFIVPQGVRVFAPWYEPSFRRDVFEPIASLSLLTEDRCYLLERLVRQAAFLEGDMAECGVYKGGAALLMASTLQKCRTVPPALLLFDTFEGMPETFGVDQGVHSAGDFGDTSCEAVAAIMEPFPFVDIRKGLIPDSFRGLHDRRFSFVHVDVDIYQSTLDCLVFFYPRMVAGGFLLFDDYGLRIYEQAEKAAVDTFFADKPEKPISLTNGQTLVIKAP